ncbi:cytochrome c3 family protein [Roseofilum sp. Guam]|uniref:cytochrome c3 family protein n=1 Tax=Roseofilum sp. Guam TaxID=2821502 RepID=UPI001B0A4B29|nr:cytochrome c3 family protein [Roseofilum sp. Guam]MBP0026905.1 cytochrome c3 family protein [Roseofilum sp. Guam]
MRRNSIYLMVWLWSVVILWGCNGAIASPISAERVTEITQQWENSVHALADVNCSTCHQESQTKTLVVRPNQESCQSCHQQQVDTFLLGKHGIRTAEGLSPLTPKMAHLPMKASAQEQFMGCNTCHDVHQPDTFKASVDSCLQCHDDTHSLNYGDSKHGSLFAASVRLPRPSPDLVTCATCHLPRTVNENTNSVFVNHNNTYTLLPRDRMVKDVCMNCHGLEYSYNSIFDDELIEGNFHHRPQQDLDTLKLVRAFEKKRTASNSE